MFCSKCGGEVSPNVQVCPTCGEPQAIVAPATPGGAAPQMAPAPAPQQVVVVQQPKNPILALILSLLVPGLGQIYNGEVGKGIMMIAGAVISGVLTIVLIGFLTGFAIWVWAMVDAYQVANKINAQAATIPQAR